MPLSIKILALTSCALALFSGKVEGQIRRCPPGWNGWPSQIRDSCYFFSRNVYTWEESRSICKGYGGDLVTFRTQTEKFRVSAAIKRRGSRFYIGFNNVVHKDKKASWVDGTRWMPWHTKLWAPREPNNSGGKEYCGEIDNNGKFNDVNCGSRRKRFICRRSRDIVDKCNIQRGWLPFADRCFRLFSETLDWRSAKRSCQENEANILVVDSDIKLGAIKETVICRETSELAWLGLSDVDAPGTLTWADGSKVTVSNWAGRQPKQLVDGDTCVEAVSAQGWRWRTSSCLNERKYICEKAQGKCAEGWKQWNGHCYQINAEKSKRKTWIAANNYCEAQGARLIDVENNAEHNRFVKPTARQLKAGGVGNFYIGASDRNVQGQFRWTTGRDLTFKKWKGRDQPRWYPGRWSCAIVQTADRDARWLTRSCFRKRAFICEMAISDSIKEVAPEPVRACYDEGWLNFRDKCYLFSSGKSLTWTESQQECSAKYGANLATISSPEIQSFISENIVASSFMGLNNRGRAKRDLRWVATGEEVGSFTNWETLHPILGVPDVNCGNLLARGNRAGVWQMMNCSWVRPFICEKVSTNQIIPGTTPATLPWSDLCGPGWIYDESNDFCYLIYNEDKGFFEGQEICKRNDGELLSIGSKHEQLFVQKILTSSDAGGGIQFWTGGNVLQPDAGWSWTDKSAFRFFNWNPGMPDTRYGANCMKIETTLNGQWVTDACEGRFPFVCKKATFNISAVTVPTVTNAPPRDCAGERMITGLHYVQDGVLQASSEMSSSTKASNSRIVPSGMEGDTINKGWRPALSSNGQWIEVDFAIPIVVKGVVTKGMSTPNSGWITTYRIIHQYDTQSNWVWYSESEDGLPTDIQGNMDSNSEVTVSLKQPFQARIIRLVPTAWSGSIGLRWDILGCIRKDCTPENVISGAIRVPDAKLTASSTVGGNNLPPSSRIDSVQSPNNGGAWTASISDQEPWIQADLGAEMRIREVTTKGRDGVAEWVTNYQLSYSVDGTKFTAYQEPYGTVKVFDGNKDPDMPVTVSLKSPIISRYIRLHPKTWVGHVSLRWEIGACLVGCQPIGLLSGDHSVKSSALSASSSLSSFGGPSRSRIDTVVEGDLMGGWTAAFNDTSQHIEADLGTNIYIRAVSTRGQHNREEWVTKYILAYSTDREVWYAYYEDGDRKIFDANSDRNTLVKNVIRKPFSARYVRLYPQASVGKISLRWELHGCPGPLSGYHLGCHVDTRSSPDLSSSHILSPIGGMTPRICINHCYHQGYLYAGIRAGDTCSCGNSFGRHGSSSSCNIQCPGQEAEKCGGYNANSVYNTGIGPSHTYCPLNWLPYKDNCYLVSASRQNYEDSRSICRDEKAHLVSIHNQDEMDFITTVVEDVEGLWIGLNDRDVSRTYEWEDESPVIYTNWDIDQPSNWATRDMNCVFSNLVNGRWTGRKCDYLKRFVCKKAKTPSEERVTTPVPDGCPRDWTLWDGNCYLIVFSKQNWAKSATNCKTMDAELVRIKSRQEQLYIRSQLSGLEGDFWTDLTDTSNPGTYTWSDGSTDVMYTNWARGQPDDSKGTCVAMATWPSLGRWYDKDCGEPMMSMCKRRQDGQTTTIPFPFSPAMDPCPNGWLQVNGNCFLVMLMKSDSEMKSWPGARADCRARGAELASFQSREELDAVWEEHIAGSLGHFWIGLNSRDINRGHTWSDLSPVTFTFWAPGEPNNAGNVEDCVEMYRNDGKWNDMRCDVRRNWICKVPRGEPVNDLSTTAAPGPGPRGSCAPNGDNWFMYEGVCYYYSDGSEFGLKSWRWAQRSCQNNKGHLVSVHSQGELNFVVGMVRRLNLTVDSFWLGLSELDLRQGYSWSDKTPLDFANWGPNEPNDDYGNEPCISMKTPSGEWYNEHCNVRKGLICKKYPGGKAPPTPTPASPMSGYCPAEFKRIGNKCFKIVSPSSEELVTFDQARDTCVNIGKRGGFETDLATISNAQEQAFINAHLMDLKYNLWIGLRQPPVGDSKKFTWVDKSPVTHSNWRSGQPDKGLTKEGNCVTMDVRQGVEHTGKWFDAFCWVKNGYVCMTKPQPSLVTPAPTDNPCPRDYQSWRGSCYLLLRSSKTWRDSQSYCARTSQGSQLVTISDHYEQSFVYSLMNQDEVGSDVWNGLSDYFTPGTFVWSDQWPVFYTAWGNLQPARPQGGCVAMGESDGLWKDIDCSTKLPSICRVTQDTPRSTLSPTRNGVCPPDDGKDAWVRFEDSCFLFKLTDSRTYQEVLVTTSPAEPGDTDPQTYQSINYIESVWVPLIPVTTTATGLLHKGYNADYECVERDAQLVSLHSQMEQEFVSSRASTARRNIWLGFHKTNTQGFVWRDNSPVNYVRWAPGQPSDKSGRANRFCVQLALNGLWNDLNCDQKRGYVCKLPMRLQRVRATVPFKTDPDMNGETTSRKNPLPPTTIRPTLPPWTPPPRFTTRWWRPSLPPRTRAPVTWPPIRRSSIPIFQSTTKKHPGPEDIRRVGVKTSGGEIAAVVILTLLLVAIIFGFIMLFKHTKTKVNKPVGFDNAVYSATDDTLEVGSTAVENKPVQVGP